MNQRLPVIRIIHMTYACTDCKETLQPQNTAKCEKKKSIFEMNATFETPISNGQYNTRYRN